MVCFRCTVVNTLHKCVKNDTYDDDDINNNNDISVKYLDVSTPSLEAATVH
jgi:hypothetical protein